MNLNCKPFLKKNKFIPPEVPAPTSLVPGEHKNVRREIICICRIKEGEYQIAYLPLPASSSHKNR